MKRVRFSCLLLLVVLCACGKLQKIDRISMKDFFTGDIIRIPMSFRYATWNGDASTNVASKRTMDELCREIEALSSSETTYTILSTPSPLAKLVKETSGDRIRIGMMRERPEYGDLQKGYSYYYEFFAPDLSIFNTEIDFLFPLHLMAAPPHLMAEDTLYDFWSTVEEGKLYQTAYPFEDFAAFYNLYLDHYGVYDSQVEIGASSITLYPPFIRTSTSNRSVTIFFTESDMVLQIAVE